MLLDIIQTYDDVTKQSLRDLWKWLVLELNKHHDPRKIMSFLGKCAIISIDEKEQLVYLWVPNEFVAQQVKKFFTKDLNKGLHIIYNDQFSLKLHTYQDLQLGEHELQIPLKWLLHIKEKVKPEALDTSTKWKLESYFGILFESKYRFSNFVVWATNELAHSAAQAIANEPWTVYNPFFIYGEVWLGKTHLMQAIWNEVMEKFPDKTVLYLPTTRFIDEVVKAIRKNNMWALQEKLDQIDVLMLDDIQFLAGKDKTQEIFHNIFNDFHSKNKQIIVTCDQPPKSLTLLEARLQSRFALGMVADITSPDIETRIAIIESKLTKKWETLDAEHIELIAETVDTNVRELEWALNIVLTKKKLKKSELQTNDIFDSLSTLGFQIAHHKQTDSLPWQGEMPKAEGFLKEGMKNSQTSRLELIIQKVAMHYDIAAGDIIWSSRKKEISFARQMTMYIAKKYFNRSLQKIWNYFWGKNHASVIYAIRQFEEKLEKEDWLVEILERFV